MRVFLALAAALAAACASGGRSPRVVTVEADGWAASDGGRPGSAPRRAAADALRRAVEKAAGVSLAARTRVRDGAAVSERMIADAAGCVRRFEVLAESACDGGRCARVRAQVETGVGACAGRPVLPPAAVEEARVSVVLTGEGAHGAEAAESAGAELRARLAGRGWTVVDREPEFRLVGRAGMKETSDPRLGALSSSRAVLLVRVETAGGRVLGEATTEAAAVDADPSFAARLAAGSAAEAALPRAADALEEGLWDSQRRPD